MNAFVSLIWLTVTLHFVHLFPCLSMLYVGLTARIQQEREFPFSTCHHRCVCPTSSVDISWLTACCSHARADLTVKETPRNQRFTNVIYRVFVCKRLHTPCWWPDDPLARTHTMQSADFSYIYTNHHSFREYNMCICNWVKVERMRIVV